MKSSTVDRLRLLFVMALWGSLGLFVRVIPLSSAMLALARACIALPIIYVVFRSKKGQIRQLITRQNIPMMISGILIGVAWILFFAGFRLTSIANVTFIYNMCPVYVMILAPLLLKEPNQFSDWVRITIAFLGFVLIVVSSLTLGQGQNLGLVYATISGMLYAVIVLINRRYQTTLCAEGITLIQLFFAALVLVIVVFFQWPNAFLGPLDAQTVFYIFLIGVVHTGIAYIWYFNSFKTQSSQTVALFTYLDPAFAVLLGWLFAHESLSVIQWLGGLLILLATSSTYFSFAKLKSMITKG